MKETNQHQPLAFNYSILTKSERRKNNKFIPQA